MERTIGYATCSFCEAACGLAVEHDGRHVYTVRGDSADPFSRGFMCPKALGLKEIHEDPDRLKKPLRRDGSRFHEISWDEAFATVRTALTRIQREHGRDAVAVYRGNPLGHSYAGRLAGLLFGGVLGTKNQFSAQSVDALARLFVAFHMYGNQALLPIPDVEHTSYFLVFGANPLVSNGSLMTLPDAKRRLAAVQERGGTIVVFDPRRTETAACADEHVFVRPGTDAFVLLAMLHVIFRERLENLGRLRDMVDGLDAVREVAARFPPERIANTTGVPKETLERIARRFATAPSAACYGRMGISTQRFGAVASWAIEVLNVVTGNLDRRGGVLFTEPAADLAAIAAALGKGGSYATYRSRVADLPAFAGELPVAALAEEIETEGSGRVRGLVTIAGNPVLSLPNGRRLDAAFEKLEFMVAVDIYLNETTRHADVILPTTFGLEREHYPILSSATAVRNRARYSPALLRPPADLPDDWQVLGELSASLLAGRNQPLSAWLVRTAHRVLRPRHLLELMLRLGPHGLRKGRHGLSVAKLGDHGVDLGPLEPRLPDVLSTPSRRVLLAPAALVADVARLESALDEHREARPLKLIGRRLLRSNNSWMHNSPKLVAGRDQCKLLVHPSDAECLGLSSGKQGRLSSRVGSLVVPIEISDEVMPGVVSLPHGYGHDRDGVELSVATKRPGTSLNDVTDDRVFDTLSGASELNGISVELVPADSA